MPRTTIVANCLKSYKYTFIYLMYSLLIYLLLIKISYAVRSAISEELGFLYLLDIIERGPWNDGIALADGCRGWKEEIPE